MIQLLFHIIIISAVCIIWGLPVLILLIKRKLQPLAPSGTHFLLLFFSGLILLAITSSWLVLFIPLKFSYLLILTALIIISTYIIQKKNFKQLLRILFSFTFKINTTNILFLFASLLLFLIVGTAYSVNIDMQLYHLQIVRWTNEYGTVQGLANIYPRLGLGSSWFNLISFFHIPFLRNQNFTYINCTLVIWFFIWLFYKFQQSGKKENRTLQLFYFLVIIYCFFDWQLFRDTANSTSYDFVVTSLIIICISFTIEEITGPEQKRLILSAITIIALTVVSFKLSGIFILILLIWQLIKSKKISYWIFGFFAGVVILAPIFIRNYITSGYPIYPLSFSIGNPDWKLPLEFTQGIQKYIILQNRYYNTIHEAPAQNDYFSFSWVSLWFKGILLQHRIICIAALSSAVLLFIDAKSGRDIKNLKIIILLLLLMSIGWFATAPDPRFGYGFLLYLAFLPFCLLFGKHITSQTYKVATWIAILCICFYSYKKGAYLLKEPALVVHTAQTQQPPYKEIRSDNYMFNVPENTNGDWNNRCFFTPLPCLCEKNPYLRYRGKHIKDGFRMIGTPDSNFVKNYTY